jgi:hypothetical protein
MFFLLPYKHVEARSSPAAHTHTAAAAANRRVSWVSHVICAVWFLVFPSRR